MKTIIAVTAFTLTVILFMGSCGSKQSETKSNNVQTEVLYHCPMDCENGKTYDKPGQCPVCNMDLVKKE